MKTTELNKSSTFLFVEKSAKLSYVELGLDSQNFKQPKEYLQPESLRLLGELAVANILLSSSLKHKGSVILQIHGKGPISLAVSECNYKGQFRSIVKENLKKYAREKQVLYSFKELVEPNGGGLFVASIKSLEKSVNTYQGIVQINNRGVDFSLEHYLNNSEQIKSWLRIFVENDVVKGILLQALPEESEVDRKSDWKSMIHSLKQIKTREIMGKNLDILLLEKYRKEKLIRTKNFLPVFRCGCKREKIVTSIRQFYKSEFLSESKPNHPLKVICEFCGRTFFIKNKELNQTSHG